MDKFIEINLLKNLNRVGKSKIYRNYWEILKQAEDVDDLVNLMEEQSNFSRNALEMAKEDAIKMYDSLKDSDIHVITVFDEDYPVKLMKMGNKRPLLLYIKGNISALKEPNLAVIGTRKPLKSSEEFEKQMVKAVIENTNRVIVSGLALGCDGIAHQTTIDQNKITIAVLPSGVNVIKPALHKKLAHEIIETGGCLVSEYDPDKSAFKSTYVERDQIVAAFSDATFVVECGIKSGTMHTVNFSQDYETPIFSYLPCERPENSYEGNEYILNKFADSVRVEYIEDFLNELNILNSSNKQVTFSQEDYQSKLF